MRVEQLTTCSFSLALANQFELRITGADGPVYVANANHHSGSFFERILLVEDDSAFNDPARVQLHLATTITQMRGHSKGAVTYGEDSKARSARLGTNLATIAEHTGPT
jgi:hypothetical protein